MTIKVQCACGTRYSFEVEPQNGVMPFRVNCPSCNADGTEAANQIIAQTPEVAQTASARLRIQATTATPAPEIPRIPVPAPPRAGASMKKFQAEARQMRLIGWAVGFVFLLILAALGGWAWFSFAGSKPSQACAIKLTGAESGWNTRFLPGRRILAADAGQIILVDVKSGRNLWQVNLPDKGQEGGPRPDVYVDKQDIWVCTHDQVLRLDETTGQTKLSVPITGQFKSFTPTASNLLVISATGETSCAALQIDLASGEVSTRDIDVPRAEKQALPDELPPNVQPTAGVLLAQATDENNKFKKVLDAVSSEFFSAGQNLVELRVKLLEPKITWVKSIKPRGPSLINGNTTASTSTTGVEEEVFNDIKRDQTGGVKGIDESTYEVRLRRWLGEKPVEWQGDVTGLPGFFSLATVDFLTAGKSLVVFDKHNNPLFRAQLSYPVSERLATNHIAPAAEHNGMLYFFDQGVLTAFQLPGGQVQWRLTSVGVRHLAFEPGGMMYVDTTAASPDEIQYSDQIKFTPTRPVIMKVDPRNGKILWQVQELGQRSFVTGKFLYTVSLNRGGSAMLSGLADALNSPRQDEPVYFHIHRLDPETGKELWDFYREDAPEEVDFQQNWFLVRFGDDLQVWKYLTF